MATYKSSFYKLPLLGQGLLVSDCCMDREVENINIKYKYNFG